MDIYLTHKDNQRMTVVFQDGVWELKDWEPLRDQLPQSISATVGFETPRGHMTLQYAEKTFADPEYPWLLVWQVLNGQVHDFTIENPDVARAGLDKLFQNIAGEFEEASKQPPSVDNHEFDIEDPVGTSTRR